MLISTRSHELLASLLTYPGPDSRGSLQKAAQELVDVRPDCAEDLEPFRELLRTARPGEVEELFTRTFDNNAERALEVGWQVFGENYERGKFMVEMRELLRLHGIEETTELPDHLSHVLRALARMDGEDAWRLVGRSVLPAVEKIEHGFQKAGNPYQGVLAAVHRVLESHVTT